MGEFSCQFSNPNTHFLLLFLKPQPPQLFKRTIIDPDVLNRSPATPVTDKAATKYKY